MASNILMNLLPLNLVAAYIGGGLYLWYRHTKGK
jgi:nitrogen fixation-related uncharacterized protein